MIHKFTLAVNRAFQQKGYLTHQPGNIPEIKATLYVQTTIPIRLGFAKVLDHFLFIDADDTIFNRLDLLKEIYKRFSTQVNLGFKTPHALRILIPNIVIVAVSQTGFSEELLSFARTSSLEPWYGGEVGQVILVDLAREQIVSLVSHSNGRYPRPGAIPLLHASNCIRKICKEAFAEDKLDE